MFLSTRGPPLVVATINQSSSSSIEIFKVAGTVTTIARTTVQNVKKCLEM